MSVSRGKWKKKVTLRCTFCGGRLCPRCGPRAAKNQNPPGPIAGLHSNWVTDRLLACQRPSSRIISEFDLAGQFRKLGINAVFNLQEPGEHPYCGDGIISSGFSYLPEEFMHEGILFYNFAWEDMTVPTCNQMLNIVKCMAYSIEGGFKIAVHCHAGYGRTGMAIACFLIYFRKWSASEAIACVKEHRPGSVQTAKQNAFVQRFQQFVLPLQLVYAIQPKNKPFTLEQALYNQYEYLHGQESRTLRWLPKIVLVLCSMLSEMAVKKGDVLACAFQYVNDPAQWEQSELNLVEDTKYALNRTRCWEKMGQNNSRVCVHLLIDWIWHLREPVFSPEIVLEFCHLVDPTARTSSSDLGGMVKAASEADTRGLVGLLGAADDARRDRLGGVDVVDLESKRSRFAYGDNADEGKMTDEIERPSNDENLEDDEVSSYCDDEGWDGPPSTGTATGEGKVEELNGGNKMDKLRGLEDLETPDLAEGSPFARASPRSPRISPRSSGRSIKSKEEGKTAAAEGKEENPETDSDNFALLGRKMYGLIRVGARPTITCLMKFISKISDLPEYPQVCEIVGSALSHLEYPGRSNNERNGTSTRTKAEKERAELIRKLVGIAIACLAAAAKDMDVPHTRHFSVEAQKQAKLTLTDSEQRRALSEILALYRKLSLERKNKALAALADLYRKFENESRNPTPVEAKVTRRDAKARFKKKKFGK
eukprot:g5860.t1